MSTVGQWYEHPAGQSALLEVLMAHLGSDDARAFPEPGTTVFKMTAGFRVQQLLDFIKLDIAQNELDTMVAKANSR